MANPEWTVMIYFAGDNNLAEEMIWAVKDIQSWWLSHEEERKKVKVVAMFDAGGPPLLVDFDKTKGKYEPEEIELALDRDLVKNADSEREKDDLKRAGSTEKDTNIQISSVQKTLTRFISKTLRNQSEYFMLVLSGHGSGAIGDFLTGDKRISGLTIPALGEVASEVYEMRDRKKIDILGLDSCQMGMAEVAFQVQDSVQFMIGAEGFTPNTGWPYEKILSSLFAKNSPVARKPEDFAEQIVQKYVEYYLPYTTAEVSTDISAINLTNLGALRDGITNFTAALEIEKIGEIENLPIKKRDARLEELRQETLLKKEQKTKKESKDPRQKDQKRTKRQPFLDAIILARREAQGYKREQYVDLWDFCSCLKERLDALEEDEGNNKGKRLNQACKDIMNAIDLIDGPRGEGIVRLSGYCGPRFQYSHGLSIYFPWASFTDAAGIADLGHYQLLKFAKDTHWDEFLRVYLHATKRAVRERYVDKQGGLHSSLLNRLTGLLTVGPGKDANVSTADRDANVSTADRSKLAIGKIESMKNPPTGWYESDMTLPPRRPKK